MPTDATQAAGPDAGKRPWFADGLPFGCTQCGKCCHARGDFNNVYVNRRERKAIAAHLGMSAAAFTRRYTVLDEEGYRTLHFETEACPFLEGAQCTIHEVKPVQCRTWPFWEELLKDRETYEKEVRSFCPGSRAGERVPREEIDRQARATEAALDEHESGD